MDSHNRTASAGTYALLRLEYLLLLAVCVALAILHFDAIDWLHFVALFVVIDLIGYAPGAVAHRRSASGRISPVFFTLYNVTHSFLGAGVVAAVWALLVGPEWALLALPIHLCGDRALFGNILKCFDRPFEPAGQTAPRSHVESRAER